MRNRPDTEQGRDPGVLVFGATGASCRVYHKDDHIKHVYPPGNAERLLGNASTNRQKPGADGIYKHYDDIPLGIARKAEQTLGVPRKKHGLMPGCRVHGSSVIDGLAQILTAPKTHTRPCAKS